MKNNNLVLGGNGKTGRKVVNRLIAQNQNVRIGSRKGSPPFDWNDRSTWSGVLDDMDQVYITYQPDLAVPGALESIEHFTKEAKRSGVSKLVLLSGKGEREAELCEQVVIHSGMEYTIIRASWFNQNFSESFFLDPILAGHVALPQAKIKVPFVDTDDIADVVVQSLIHPEKHNDQIYQLTGPRLLTFPDVITEISNATERLIKFTPITQGAYTSMLKENQVPSDYIWLINYLFTEVLSYQENHIVTDDIQRVLGRNAKDFTQYAQDTADTGVWNPAK